ncbi:hypothetical protein C8R45DRAFT_1132480 [Mycena sanguinolenta]|nr:hypothetical protein C8R45DRAFT_1132480 [Mycena sanguinolenta]
MWKHSVRHDHGTPCSVRYSDIGLTVAFQFLFKFNHIHILNHYNDVDVDHEFRTDISVAKHADPNKFPEPSGGFLWFGTTQLETKSPLAQWPALSWPLFFCAPVQQPHCGGEFGAAAYDSATNSLTTRKCAAGGGQFRRSRSSWSLHQREQHRATAARDAAATEKTVELEEMAEGAPNAGGCGGAGRRAEHVSPARPVDSEAELRAQINMLVARVNAMDAGWGMGMGGEPPPEYA